MSIADTGTEETAAAAGTAISFEDVVCSSLCPEQTTPAWCDKCKKYQTTKQTRSGFFL